MGRNCVGINVVDFGKILFESADLDPLYVALLGGALDRDQLCRWLVAYWCFYSSGFASLASERVGRGFWQLMTEAAVNTTDAPTGGRWPRGAERRHFRGKTAVEGVKQLEEYYGSRPEGMIDYLVSGKMDIDSVIQRAKTHKYFGNWIAFKISDMIDAVLRIRVAQDDLTVFLYDSPRKSIDECYLSGAITGGSGDRYENAMNWLWGQLQECKIPHKPTSAPDWFSLETVWCKHLSHMHGHYPLYKDTIEIREGLEPWSEISATAHKLLKAMPEVNTKEGLL